MTNPEWYQARTLIGGLVEVGDRVHRDLMLGDMPLIVVDTEDGKLEFTEDEAFNLIGALSMRLMAMRRARHNEALNRWLNREDVD